MAYDQPDTGAGFAPSNHPEWIGQVFLIWPKSEETVTFTRDNGEPDPTLMVTADVAIISLTDSDTGKPVFLKDAKIGGKGMAPYIRPSKPGREILGKLTSKPAPKGRSYILEVPDSNSPEWAAMCTLADQYQAAFPRAKYDNAAPSPTTAAPTWATPPAPAAAATPAWGAPAPATATAAVPAWGAPAAAAPSAPPTPSNNVASWPPGLADFLASRGYDVNQIPDEAAARSIAATLQ